MLSKFDNSICILNNNQLSFARIPIIIKHPQNSAIILVWQGIYNSLLPRSKIEAVWLTIILDESIRYYQFVFVL
jgi:hypothetical protein